MIQLSHHTASLLLTEHSLPRIGSTWKMYHYLQQCFVNLHLLRSFRSLKAVWIPAPEVSTFSVRTLGRSQREVRHVKSLSQKGRKQVFLLLLLQQKLLTNKNNPLPVSALHQGLQFFHFNISVLQKLMSLTKKNLPLIWQDFRSPINYYF